MTNTEYLELNINDRQPVSVYSRCMGYLAPRHIDFGKGKTRGTRYNKGKQSEFDERTYFTEEVALRVIENRERKVA